MVYQLKRLQNNKRPQAFWGALIPSAINFVGGLITSSQQAKAQKRALEEQKRLAQQQFDISNQNQLASTLNNYAFAQQSYDDKDYNLKYRIGGVKRLGGRNIMITDGGNAKRIGNNTYLLRGGSHEDINETGQTGIGINVGGNEIEAEGGEVAQRKGNSLRIYSAQPILGGISPAEAIMRGYNKDKVFNAQQRFKKNNGIKDDGTKQRNGGLTSKDRGSSKHPYPSVSSKDFAGNNRSYPIPTKADAIDALRLAGLHGRNDVRSKVYSKYPELRKKAGFGDFVKGTWNFLKQPRTMIDNMVALAIANQIYNPYSATNKKKGKYGGGKSFSGAGAGGTWTNVKPATRKFNNFNDAYDDAVNRGATTFKFGNKLYNTKAEGNPIREINNRAVGSYRDTTMVNDRGKEYGVDFGPIKGPATMIPLVYDTHNRRKHNLGGRPKALDGDEFAPIKGGYYPKSDEQQITNWMSYWLNNRRRQLYNNMKKTSIRKEDAGSWLGNGRPEFTFKLIKGMSPERRKINGVFYNQINRAASATIDKFNTISNPNYLGEFDEDGKLIRYDTKNKKFNNGVRVHERTHASDAYPQYKAIEDILKTGKVNFPNSEFIDDEVKHYHTDPNEIYSRIMQYRYNNKLKPNQIIDKKYINSHRKQLKDLDLNIFDDNTLSRFFNEVADNGKRDNINPTYMARFGTYFKDKTRHVTKRMGGLTNPPVERFKCGGYIRPKAEDGMLAPIYSYGTDKRRLPSFAPIDVTPRAIPNFKPATQDYIGLGIDTLAALGSGMFTRSAYNKMNFDYALPNYVDESPVAFDTTYHNEAQRANIERNRLNSRNLISGNTSSAQTALGRMQQTDTDAMMETNKLLDEKSNKEVELRNQNLANEQQVRARNAAARNQYYQSVAQIKNAALEAKNNMELARAQSIGADLSGLSQAWSNFAGSVEQRYNTRQNEAIIAATSKDPAVLSNAVQFGYNFSPEVLAAIYNSTDDDNLKSLALSRLSTKNRLRYGIR